jgi:uncharacterized protein YegL
MSTNHSFNPDFANDLESRCPIMLLLDVSQSMEGEPIKELQNGLKAFANYLKEDALSKRRVEVGVIAFGDEELEIHDFAQARVFEPPVLQVRGTTPLGAAVHAGLDEIEKRVAEYQSTNRNYYCPWLFLLTDGESTDDWRSAAERVKVAEKKKDIHFFAVGVEGADMDILNQLSFKSARKLEGFNFASLFKWVSEGLIAVSHSGVGDRVALPPTDDWASL